VESVYINTDLSPAAAKLAFEARQLRRVNRQRRSQLSEHNSLQLQATHNNEMNGTISVDSNNTMCDLQPSQPRELSVVRSLTKNAAGVGNEVPTTNEAVIAPVCSPFLRT
jgi:hypothetical protein